MTTINARPTPPRRSIAALKLPKSVPALITQAQNIVQAVTNNPSFPAPAPPLPAVTAAIEELQSAESVVLSRTRGAAATRNQRRAALVRLLEQLKYQVQSTADTSLETAASIIQSAGMTVKATPLRRARPFAAKPGAVSGAVNLFAPAAAQRASYQWQYSADGGKSWITGPSTIQARTTFAGFSPGALMLFRYRAVTRSGEGDWSQPTSLMVT